MMTSSIFRLIEYDLQQPPVPAAPQDDTNTQREEMDGGFIDIDVATGSQAPLAPPVRTPAARGRGRPHRRPQGSFMARGDEHHPKNNGLSKPARRGGHGRGRPCGSGA